MLLMFCLNGPNSAVLYAKDYFEVMCKILLRLGARPLGGYVQAYCYTPTYLTNASLQVTAHDDSILRVHEPKRPNPNTLTHDVQLIDYHSKLEQTPELMSVAVASRLTGQRIAVHVDTRHVESLNRPVCRASQHSPLAAFLHNDEYVLKIVGSIACILVIYLGKSNAD